MSIKNVEKACVLEREAKIRENEEKISKLKDDIRKMFNEEKCCEPIKSNAKEETKIESIENHFKD